MPKLLRTLFTRADPVMDALVERTKAQSAETVAASNRLHATITELLDRNDTLTFRRQNDASKASHQ
jgi:hypothetical protein